MAFDGIAVSVIVQELNDKLRNTRIVKIYQVDQDTVIFHLRGLGENLQLLISTAATYPRIHTTKINFENPLTPPAFCMLLRKYLEPSRILTIQQHQLERIIKINFETYDHQSGQNQKTLIFELMGRHSNLTLVDQDYLILDSINRMTENNNIRAMLPGVKYTFPPHHGKVNPHQLSKTDFIDSFRLLPANIKLYQGLIQLYQGFGPEAAQEAIRRSDHDPNQLKQAIDIQNMEELWDGLQDFLNQPGSPVLVKADGKTDFYAYHISKAVKYEEYTSLDLLLDNFYTAKITQEKIQQKANSLRRALNTHLKRVVKKEKIQRDTIKTAAKGEKWQKLGQLVTANIHRINQGDIQVEVIDYYQPEQPMITIQLDQQLSPSENAQRFFKRYKKSKTSQKVTAGQLEKTVAERSYLENVIHHIEVADSLIALDEIETELINEGYIKSPKSRKAVKKKAGTNYDTFIAADGTEILVGRNNQQNDALTFRLARPDDLWLHVQKIPGSHVIIRNSNQISEETLQAAATLAAYYSKARNSAKVAVDYTQRKHVRKPSGGKPGFVYYDNFKTVLVNPTDQQNLPKKRDLN